MWQSPPGHMYGALRLPLAPPFDGSGAALAVAFFFGEILGGYGWEVNIKWPNDLILGQCKVGGILVESKRKALVAGVGFNLLKIPSGSWSGERELGAPLPGFLPWTGEPKVLWSALVKKFILLYKDKFKGMGMADLVSAVEKKLLWRGLNVVVDHPSTSPSWGSSTLTGRISGLDTEGQLLIDSSLGGQYKLWSGTVRLVQNQ